MPLTADKVSKQCPECTCLLGEYIDATAERSKRFWAVIRSVQCDEHIGGKDWIEDLPGRWPPRMTHR